MERECRKAVSDQIRGVSLCVYREAEPDSRVILPRIRDTGTGLLRNLYRTTQTADVKAKEPE
jgi:hypothetical protein